MSLYAAVPLGLVEHHFVKVWQGRNATVTEVGPLACVQLYQQACQVSGPIVTC